MTADLGEPCHYAHCDYCGREVGGPYYEKPQAVARVKEHIANLHSNVLQRTWEPRKPKYERERRASFTR